MKNATVLAVSILTLGALPTTAAAATGPQIWAQEGCAGCHTLQAAGAYGQGGPNLDSLRPSSAAVAAQVTSGGPGMPAFGGSLSGPDIQALASWVAASTGGPASAPSTGATSTGATSTGATSTGAASPAGGLQVPLVRRVQRDLRALGYFEGPVTGFYGPLTTAAVKAFQQASGLAPDGVWGPRTNAALAARTASRRATSGSTRTLSVGSVRRLQRELARLGYFDGPFTGFYGLLTTAAVERFQQAQGLKPDGIWGPRSAAAMRRRLA